MDKKVYDFSGWATRTNIKCSDGRTIKDDAFAHQNGKTVPLVWQHNHDSVDNVLGHALLENRKGGVYCYGKFNDNEEGRKAKELVRNGDIEALSIYANQLKQVGGDVVHGAIREVSLVLSGANPGALIDSIMVHGEDSDNQAEIYNEGTEFEIDVESEFEEVPDIEHSCEDKEKELEHAEETKTVQEIFDSMSKEQQDVCYYMIGQAIEKERADKENVEHSNKEDISIMDNAFEKNNQQVNEENVLTHSELNAIVKEAKTIGSMKEAFLAHSITDIENLFPEFNSVTKEPLTINVRTEWVDKVLKAVGRTPFSRVKGTLVDITGDDARAKGFVKGNQKVEEVVAALKRTTTPTTIYKLQKLDRDDILDITDFDVVPYIKKEMRGKLDEELARAILIGDGRSADSNDKINPLNIRPVLGDNSLYTIKVELEQAAGKDEYAFASDLIDQAVIAADEYRGSGNCTYFIQQYWLTRMLLLKDTNGHRLYKTKAELAAAMGVAEVVPVEAFKNVVREGDETDTYDYELIGVIVNLIDYNIGCDKGGQVSLFNDFDINFNKYEYLIETRCSGALIKPYSAISFEKKVAKEVVEG